MKIQVSIIDLQKKISYVQHAVSLRSQLPILLNFLIQAKNNILTISATDLEIGMQASLPITIEEEGETTVPAKIFSELISSLPIGTATLKTQNSTLEVISSHTKSMFQTMPTEDFPKLYEEKGEQLTTLKKEDLHNDFSKVVFAASSDIARPALSGVLIKRDETINKNGFLLVATDGYRLSLKHHAGNSISASNGSEKHILIPSRVIREVLMSKEGDEEIALHVSEKSNQIFFTQGVITLVGRLIDAQYPQFEKIIPTDYGTQVEFDKEALQKAVKICSIFARETANIVKFQIQKGRIIVSANTPSVGQNTVDVEVKLTGEENEIAFNARYLLDLFANIDQNDMVFEMTGPLSPGVFKIKGDSSFLHIIMPIRVQSEQ